MGPLAAAELGTEWVDLDREVERREGRTVSEIFAADGEERFRALERAAMQELLQGQPLLISAGGGWPAVPGNVAAAEARAFIIYLSVSPGTAAARLGGAADRPLLAGDPLPGLVRQLAERERWYRLAGIEVPADGPAAGVAAAVATVGRQYGGWP